MRYVSDTMLAKINSGHTTFCNCYRLSLNGGSILTITDLDKNIIIGSETYLSAPGISATRIDETSGFEPSNLELDILIDGTVITEPLLQSGKFDRAKAQMFIVDYEDLPVDLNSTEIIWLKTGTIGNIQIQGDMAKVELRGFEQALKQNIVATGSRFCRATLGDNTCKVNLASFSTNGIVVSHKNKAITFNFSQAQNLLSNGYIEITAGEYLGARFDIATNDDISATLIDDPEITLTGLSIKAVAGCDKALNTCRNQFSNVINYQGEPHVPTRDNAVAGKQAKTGSVSQSSSGGGK